MKGNLYTLVFVFGFAFLAVTCSIGVHAQTKKGVAANDRKLWISYLDRIARPVMMNLANDQLKEKMMVVLSNNVDNKANRLEASYLEAFGRTLSGISPWLNAEGGSKEEIDLRNQYRQWAVKAVSNAVNPQAKDYMKWTGDNHWLMLLFLRSG